MPLIDGNSGRRMDPRISWPFLAVLAGLSVSGCGSSSKTPGNDASGMDGLTSMDSSPDTMTTDTGGILPDTGDDAAPDGTAADAGPNDTGSTDAGDGGPDPCKPPCLYKLVGGCLPEGSCMRSGASYCYSNGVKQIALPPGMIDQSYFTKDGVRCATVQAGGTYVDPNGVVLGRIVVNSDGTNTATCTGEDPVVIPATCRSPAAGCPSGTCTP